MKKFLIWCIGGAFCLSVLVMYGCRSPATTTPVDSTFSPAWFHLNSVNDLYDFFDARRDQYPLISAHRGGPKEGFPENAIATFEQVSNAMPVIIECDVRMTQDSVLVLMHDETLNRTTSGTGELKKTTFQELSQLRLKDASGRLTRFPIPTLEEALLWGKDRVIFSLDVKHAVPYEKVLEVMKRHRAEAYSMIITYSASQARVLHQLAPDVLISASIKTSGDLARLLSSEIPPSRLVAFVGTREPDEALYKQLYSNGIKSILGTMGNLDRSAERSGYQRYAEFVKKGANILSTDRPFEAQKALDYFITSRQITSDYLIPQ